MHISRKSPWRLSPTRKANQRHRLKKVDSVIEAVQQSGVQLRALVGLIVLDALSSGGGIRYIQFLVADEGSSIAERA